MDRWPCDDRPIDAPSAGRKSKGKAPEKQMAYNYPSIGNGAINALTLVENNGRLEWSSITKTASQVNPIRKLCTGKSVSVFPATREPALHIPRTSIVKRAEQGANFLRTYLPDVDIATEIIRDQVAEDTKLVRDLQKFDLYAGNLLETVVKYDGPVKRTGYLAFPMGELKSDLNLSPFSVTKGKGTTIRPSAAPTRCFNTPIQQIVTSKSNRNTRKQNSFLAIRTYGSTHLLQLNFEANSSVLLSELAAVSRSDVDGRYITDIKLSSSPFTAFMANDCGAVYSCNLDNDKHMVQLYSSQSEFEVETLDPFWRLALGSNSSELLHLSNKKANLLDLRTNVMTNLFTISNTRDLFTSIEDIQSDGITRICSTREILWIDHRYPGKPLLGYDHGRHFDRTLRTQTIPLETSLTMLSSRKNGLVTIYDVSRYEGNLTYANTSPYCISRVPGTNSPHIGQTVLLHPGYSKNSGLGLLQLSERAEVHHVELHLSDLKENDVNVEKSPELRALEVASLKLRPDIGPLGGQDLSQVDLSAAYDYMFRVHTEEVEQVEEEKAEAVYELLERLPAYWQDAGAPVEQMLTTYDIAFRAGEEPEQASRADFLTGSLFNSTRGYRALVQGRLSAQPLKSGASWHHNIERVLRNLDTDTTNAEALAESFRRYDLCDDDERSARSFRRETTAREQLALDLALSQDVFSSQSFVKPSDADHMLETMTEALSLGDEPPTVDFGYLRPIPKGEVDYYSREEIPEEVIFPIGVRLLMRDWEVGMDPEKYVYTDPYDGTASVHSPRRTKAHMPSPPPTQSTIATQPIRPPMIIMSSSIAPTQPDAPGRRMVAQSQMTLPPRVGFGSQPSPSQHNSYSQEFMASTQILPGPFGGRPSVAKKKPAKKRLGGF